ncbi:hypothetical protein CROQUDRAFT_652123 [Cronartium quercuum f. sp. fusiforme G11]|uniref:Mitochondrial genome maintenance protein MGM101 n=1 Tax=Cronartium quercuum f. sp. fusiforme G11 TaxID=708437 RepID=A0A9P6TG15_9BASI|nr:hypothetical protein CROQUDRAFT_652123 [Cronartium quercuum f. sp. fusiforme G11]
MTPTRLMPIGVRWLSSKVKPSTTAQLVRPRLAPNALSCWRLSSTLTPDPFAAFDRATRSPSSKNAPKIVRSSASNSASTSVPLSATTASSGQSAAIEAHPATSAAELHPLPIPVKAPTFPGGADADASNETPLLDLDDSTINWSQSFSGLSKQPFSKEVSQILMAPLDPDDVEIKPDGVIYLPEIKYRRILNEAFGPGGWGLAPRGSSHVTTRNVSREYALICLNRLVSLTRGEQDYFNGVDSIPTATEGCKSNALMRCCKDLGVASELWDPNYINWWKTKYATVEWTVSTGGKKKGLWKKKRSEAWTPRLPPKM